MQIIILPPLFCLRWLANTLMPIHVDSEVRVLSKEEFYGLSHRIMGVAFGVHNDFGRLLDEETYKKAIRRRCEAAGIVPARSEVEITVRHQNFQKSYFMDLWFDCGLMVEAKTADALSASHYAQAIHYLLLTGTQHGLLINLRSGCVSKRFVSTTLTPGERQSFVVHDAEWQPVNDSSRQLYRNFLELLTDWGAFLQTALYREAIIHLFGGEGVALQRIPVFDGDVPIGTQEVCLIADDTGMALTALKAGKSQMKTHLHRLLSHTRLTCLQWINMDNHNIEFRTLQAGYAE